jgi:DNA-directed RNA polymerase subunit K/omega
MAKVNELVYDIREAINAFSDDYEIDDRYILYLYDIKRAKYLRQDVNNFQKTIDNSIKQTLCLAMEEVSVNECSVDYSCGNILRSKQKLPKPIESHTKVAISKVKPVNRIGIPFSFIEKDRAPFIENAPFPNAIYAFIDVDNYIYAYSKSEDYKLLDCITVTGVFEDPTSLSAYSTCCCEDAVPCYDIQTSDYPLQPHYIDLIREEIIKDLLRSVQVPEDKVNDSTD